MRRRPRFTTYSFIWGIFLLSGGLYAQDASPQSDSTEVQLLLKKGKEETLSPGGWLSGLSYFADAYRLAQQKADAPGIAEALRQMALVEMKTSKEQDQALRYLLKELEIRDQLGDKEEIAKTYETLGDLFYSGAYPDWYQALNYYQQALIIVKEVSPKSSPERKAFLHQKIADSYQALDSLEPELKHREQLIRYLKVNPEPQFLALREACHRALEAQLLQKAKSYLEQAQDLCEEIEDKKSNDFARQKCEEDLTILQKDLKGLERKRQQTWLWNLGLGGLALLLLSGIIYVIRQHRRKLPGTKD